MLPLSRAPQPIHIIRYALIAGVLLFGAVILFVHSLPNWKPAALPSAVGYAQAACAVFGVLFARAMRGRVAAESDLQRRVSLLVTGWAVGEGAALFGGAIFFITGQSQWYLLGLLGMAGAFMSLRVRATP
jgi:hypothetical protein